MNKLLLVLVLTLASADLGEDIAFLYETDFGNSLISMIDTNMGADNAFGVIDQELTALDADLISQQQADDTLWLGERQPECDTLIAQYTDDVDTYHSDMTKAEAARNAAQVALDAAQAAANQKEGEILSLEEDIFNFNATWSQDQVNGQQRSQDHQDALDAINQAIVYMEGLVDDSADAGDADIDGSGELFLQINSLIELATGADQTAVEKIIGMLENIRKSLEDALAIEVSTKGDASGHFHTVLAEMRKTLSDLKDAKAILDAEVINQTGIFNVETTKYNEAQSNWTTSKDLLEAKQKECELWEQEYNANKAKRTEERDIIAQVKALFVKYQTEEWDAYFA